MSEYNKKQEEALLTLVKEKQLADKRLLKLEIFIGISSSIILLGLVILAALLNIKDWLRVVLILIGFIFGFVGFFVAVRIEQVAGYYECKECGHKYVPSYKDVNMAPHMLRTRYMKCPNCGKKSWQKKVINK